MNFIIVAPGLIGDSIISTPAITAFYKHLQYRGGDTLELHVIEEIFDVYENFEYADKVISIRSGKDWDDIQENTRGQWIKISNTDVHLVLDASIAFNECANISNAYMFGHEMHGYAKQIGVNITDPHFVISKVSNDDHKIYLDELISMSGGKKIAICAPYSRCCASREGKPPTKMIPFSIWRDIRMFLEAKNYYVLFVSAPSESESKEIGGNWRVGENLLKVGSWLHYADFCITLDNGISHLSSAVDANILHFNAAVPPQMVSLYNTNGIYYAMDKYFVGGPNSFNSKEIIKVLKDVFLQIQSNINE